MRGSHPGQPSTQEPADRIQRDSAISVTICPAARRSLASRRARRPGCRPLSPRGRPATLQGAWHFPRPRDAACRPPGPSSFRSRLRRTARQRAAPRQPPPVHAARLLHARGHASGIGLSSTTTLLKTTNRNFTPSHPEHAHARPAHGGNGLFRQWQHADAQAAAARRRVRLGSVADGSGVSEADVCDALLKERRAGALAAQLLQHFGAARVRSAEPVDA
jgi:hypothetical protein